MFILFLLSVLTKLTLFDPFLSDSIKLFVANYVSAELQIMLCYKRQYIPKAFGRRLSPTVLKFILRTCQRAGLFFVLRRNALLKPT
jgi:hypothetical protein